MAQTILVAGATGNTGRSVVETLSKLLSANNTFSGYRILALTRFSKGTVAQQLAQLPGVEVAEKNWVEITADWLRQHNVERAFIASHNMPVQFAEESTFHVAALQAGVKYVVRISTTAAYVRPDCPSYYPRAHWAIEALLDSPAFRGLQWTSLQPNIFGAYFFGPAAEFVKNFRRTGKQEALRLMASEDTPIGVIDADEVGILAAHLLAQQDPTRHNKARYVLNGPEDITGHQIVKMAEDHIGTQVEDVHYKDTSLIDQMAAQSPESKHLILSIKDALYNEWSGESTASTTSKEILKIAAPKKTPADMFKALLEQ